jgi:hypothetical protein
MNTPGTQVKNQWLNKKTESDRMDEEKLIHKLRLIESLFAGGATEGEKVAAEQAKDRILERLKQWGKTDPPVEYRFTMADMWSRKVFVALLRRYGIHPYRYSGQRYTTVMANVSRGFVNETLWPEFQEIFETLQNYLSDITDRVVHQVIHQDHSEAEIVEKPKQLMFAEAGSNGAADSTRIPANSKRNPQDGFTDRKISDSSKGNSRNKRRKRKKRKHR